jgi:hypothetical protein
MARPARASLLANSANVDHLRFFSAPRRLLQSLSPTRVTPTALDNRQRSTRKQIGAVVRRLLYALRWRAHAAWARACAMTNRLGCERARSYSESSSGKVSLQSALLHSQTNSVRPTDPPKHSRRRSLTSRTEPGCVEPFKRNGHWVSLP